MTQRIASLIIDDEINSRENIGMLLEDFCPQVKVMGAAANVRTARDMILRHRPELVFLDIQLGSETAFSLLQQLPKIDFEIIFITAHDHYARKASEFKAVDYLLKPVDISRLLAAADIAAARIARKG